MSFQPPYLVQTRDAEGFWVNVYDAASWPNALKLAEIEARETKRQYRAVCGPKREMARYFGDAGRLSGAGHP